MRRTTGVLLIVGMLAACQPLPPGGGGGGGDETGRCGAPGLQRLIGQPARVLATMKFAGPVRFIRPGDAVTEDYGPDRLNIEINLREVISSVWCG